jgi:hypothetical protein
MLINVSCRLLQELAKGAARALRNDRAGLEVEP